MSDRKNRFPVAPLPRCSCLRPSAAAIALALAASGTGCAVMNPYVSPEKSGKQQKCEVELPYAKLAGDLGEGICEAERWRSTYYKAAGDYAKFRNVSAAVMLPLSAAAVFDGIAGLGGKGEIARLSLGAATVYGANVYYTDVPRQKIYFLGARAMSCAVLAARPLARTEEWLNRLNRLVGDQSCSITATRTKLSRLKSTFDAIKDDAVLSKSEATRLRVRLRSAERALSAADAIQAKANAAKFAIETSGFLLRATVTRIADDVSLLLAQSEPKSESLLAAASGLANAGKSLSGGALVLPESTETPRAQPVESRSEKMKAEVGANTEKVRRRAQLYTDVEALAATQNAMVTASALLDAYVSSASVSAGAGALEDCGVGDAEASTDLTVSPSASSFTLKTGSSITLNVLGGSGTPDFRLSGADVDAFTISRDAQPKSMTLAIKANKPTSDAGTTLLITDGSKNSTKEVVLHAEP